MPGRLTARHDGEAAEMHCEEADNPYRSGRSDILGPYNRYGVDTPIKGGASVSLHEFVMHRLAFGWSNPKTGRDYGRRPRQPAGNVQATRASVPAPKTSADARRPRRESRTQFGNPRYPDRESGPIPGGWAGPTNPLGDRLPAGQLLMASRAESEGLPLYPRR